MKKECNDLYTIYFIYRNNNTCRFYYNYTYMYMLTIDLLDSTII